MPWIEIIIFGIAMAMAMSLAPRTGFLGVVIGVLLIIFTYRAIMFPEDTAGRIGYFIGKVFIGIGRVYS